MPTPTSGDPGPVTPAKVVPHVTSTTGLKHELEGMVEDLEYKRIMLSALKDPDCTEAGMYLKMARVQLQQAIQFLVRRENK